MEDSTFSGEDDVLVLAILQNFKSACDVRGINKNAAMCLFKQYPTGVVVLVVQARVMLSTYANFNQGGALKLCSANFQFFLEALCDRGIHKQTVRGGIQPSLKVVENRGSRKTITVEDILLWVKT